VRAGLIEPPSQDEGHPVVPQPAGGKDDRFGGLGVEPLFVVDDDEERRTVGDVGGSASVAAAT
jgi:hypothetical protein